HGPRPAESREPLAAHPAAARAARHDGVPHHPLPRGGRPLRRTRHGDGPRSRHRRRHRAAPQGDPRGRRAHARFRGCGGRRAGAPDRAGPHRSRGAPRRRHHDRHDRARGRGPAADRHPAPGRRGHRSAHGNGRASHPRRRLPRAHRPHPAGGGRDRGCDCGIRARRERADQRTQHRDGRSPAMTTETPAPATARTAVRPNLVRDSRNVLVRELRPVLRDPFTLIFSLVQPLVFLGLFAPLLIGQSGQPAGETLQWFVPGVLVMIVLVGTAATGSNLQYEMMSGSHERTLVAPLSRSALLVGRALKEVAPIVVQAIIILAVAWPFGFAINVPGLIAGLVMLAVFGIGLGSLSYTLALSTKDREWLFWGVQQTLIFPLLILSGMLLPLSEGPDWMRAV